MAALLRGSGTYFRWGEYVVVRRRTYGVRARHVRRLEMDGAFPKTLSAEAERISAEAERISAEAERSRPKPNGK